MAIPEEKDVTSTALVNYLLKIFKNVYIICCPECD